MVIVPKNNVSSNRGKQQPFQGFKFTSPLLVIILLLMWGPALAQVSNDVLLAQDLKKMSIEELMNLEVISVSKRPEKLTEVASAIQVITQDDIRRSAATSLPEVLRLATNLQAHIISARGFNALFSNKLLVMIDGRYTHLFLPGFSGMHNRWCWRTSNELKS
ncbi:MAG: TonB-dependent receptor plug domain-containing protein [Anditalea sp.]